MRLKYSLRVSIFAALYMWSNAFASSGTKISASTTDYQAGLGDGWSSNHESIKGHCLNGKAVSQGISRASLEFKQSISYNQLENELGFGAAGRARFGMLKMNASARFLSNSKSDAYSIAGIYEGSYEFKNLVLTSPKVSKEMKKIIDKDEQWEEACGNEYIQQLGLGAKIFFSIRIDFASEAEKKLFESQFSLQGPLFGVSADLKTASNQLSKRTTVTISTLQIGGEVDKISGIFGNPDNVVSCSLGKFEECGTVLSAALKYATQEFPKQISKETHNTKEGTGPVVTYYLTKPYSAAGIFPKNAPEVSAEIKRARLKLNQWLTQYHALWIYANRYGKGSARRLSQRQVQLITGLKTVIDDNLQKVATVAQACYDVPNITCVTAVNGLGQSGDQPLEQINEKAFVIENESFSQFCDDGLSPSPLATTTLKNSINGLLDLAKSIRPEAFTPPAKDIPVDECFNAEVVFLGQTSLKASSRSISDLRPLMQFRQLEVIDLSDNDIESLDPFNLPFAIEEGGFAKLRELNLHNNHIKNIAPLKEIHSLQQLNLSNNSISQADDLKVLPNLVRVDLRNNSQDLNLDLNPAVIVLTADHGNSPTFSAIEWLTGIPRFGHAGALTESKTVLIAGGVLAPSAAMGAELFDISLGDFSPLTTMGEPRIWPSLTELKDKTFFICGGSDKTTAEIFNPLLNSFIMARSEMTHARAAHTATRLADGSVLVTGGWRTGLYDSANLSAEIFDPDKGQFRLLETGLSIPRAGHTATMLPNGKVIFIGGINEDEASNSADIFDPQTGRFDLVKRRMQFKRAFHTATPLKDGKLLILGGFDGKEAVSSAEIFDPVTESFQVVKGQLKFSRMGHKSLMMPNGVVLIVGGSTTGETITNDRTCKGCLNSVEIYDPSTFDFTLANSTMIHSRVFHSVTPLDLNRYLIVGGLGDRAATTAEIMTYSSPNGVEASK